MTGVAIMELIEQGQDGSAGVPIDHLGTMLQKLGVDDVCGRIALEFVHVCSGGAFGGKLGRAIDEVVPCSGGETILAVEAGFVAHGFGFHGGHESGGGGFVGGGIALVLFPPFVHGYI